MSFEMPASPGEPARRRNPAARRRSRRLLPTLLILAALLVVFAVFTNVYTDWLWFDTVNYTQVFTTELRTRTLLFVLFGALLGGAVAANFLLAYRFRPTYPALTPDQQNLERYRTGVEPLRKLIVIGSGLLLALIAGSSAAAQWRTYLLWRNRQPFGVNDPQFGVDVAYYAFALPWWRFVLSFLFTTLVLSLIAAAMTHYLYGGLRLQGAGERTSPAARVHLSVLLGLFVLAKAVAYWLDRHSLAVKDDPVGQIRSFVGLRYTDVEAVLPAKTILMWISIICALLFFATIFRRTWLLPAIGVGLLAVSALLVGNIIPAVVQYFQVRPSEVVREAEYISRNINATRAAYDIADAEYIDYEARTQVQAAELSSDGGSVPGARLVDPAVISPTVRQLQQIRPYYGFADSLDVDRYEIEGRPTDVVVGVRELNRSAQPGAGNWINDTTVYTHGYGLVAARGNVREANGEPRFVERDIPPTGELGPYEPRIYFGETSPEYSIVGAPAGASPQELDYPDDTAPGGQRNYTYTGDGGVPVGSLVNRLVYAMKFQEQNILLSSLVNEESQLLYIRSPRERVEKVAPWLTLDGDPYPAVVDGRVQWIVDGYTTSAGYPYSTRTTLDEATADAAARRQAVAQQAPERVNYIRNSVKATVDAYDGSVQLYAWDEDDPVLRTWRQAFPGTVRDRSEISPNLLQHLRYPQDLFKVQRTLLEAYHVSAPDQLYGATQAWSVPLDPSTEGRPEQSPYYLTVQMPGQPAPRFSLTTAFVLAQRPNLSAFAAVEAEPGDNYGKLRVLQVPSGITIAGPEQASNQFNSDPVVAPQLNLLRRGGSSDIVNGNLLTLPAGGGLLYVQPVYVRAAGATGFPLLQKVVVGFGASVGFGDTLEQALGSIQASPGAAGSSPPPGGATPSPAPSGSPPPGASPPPSDGSALGRALADAQSAIRDSDAALRRGDFGAYGQAQERLRDAIARAQAAQRPGAPSGRPSASPSASPGATATPSPTASPTTAPANFAR